jgi:hypothetical protein
MVRVFDLLLMLYPVEYRSEFGDEMRAVFMALTSAGNRSYLAEFAALMRGAVSEHWHRVSLRATASMAGGTVFAFGLHVVMYWSLVPDKGKSLGRVLEHLASRIFMIAMLAGVAFGQQQPRQDVATLELANSIYSRALTALQEAKTMDDMRKLADDLASPDGISVDRFGRTVLTRKEADGELASMLALPPERRVTQMDILWAEQNSDRLIVVAWVLPNEVERIDTEGDFGPPGSKHRLTRGTLVRDIFQKTADGWRRIQHDKLFPNDTVLAVDGMPRIVPPLDERNRVVPK